MNIKHLPAVLCVFLIPTVYGLDWPPSTLSADDHVYVVPVEVESVSTDPAAITFRLHKTDYALDVYRKNPDSLLWGTVRATLPAGTATWTDTTAVPGTAYEYRFHAQGVPSAWDSTHVRSYVLAGIDVDRSGPRGRVVLVMPASIQAPLAPEIARFKQDLVGDGWIVHEVLTPDGRTDFTCAADGHHVDIRNDIIDIYNAHPGEVKHVILLGRVPQPRSGLRAAWAPDGHGDLGAVAADMYYADVDNTWTDTGSINVGYGNNAGTVRPAWFNDPGDGRFDQSHFRHLEQAFEMGWGRIDFRGAVNGGDEIGALRNYLNKLHDYKHAQNGFVPGRRSIVRDAGGLYKHVQEEFWKVITPLSGMENLEYITGNDLPNSPGQPEAQYTYDNGPYLYFFMAGNEPNQPSDNSRAVFWTGFKSHVGYHDLNSWTRSRLAEPNSWTLSWTFAPPRGRYVYHKMALGGTMGDVMLATINNNHNSAGLYGSAVKNYINGAWTVQNPSSGPGDYAGFTFHNHMGDPTLRDQMIASPLWVRGRLLSGGSQVQVEWLASPDATHGYDVYSAPSTLGPFTKRNGSPLHVNATSGELSWTDTAPSSDPVVYMVRALKMEDTPSGSYLNASIGRMVEVDRSPAPFAIVTAELPNAYLGSSYDVQLETSGGNPPAIWTVTSGTLPSGLSLSPSGLISGTPANAGSFPLTLQAVDLLGATQSQSFTLAVDMFSTWTLLPNGDFASPPHNTGAVNQGFSGNWQHPAAPNSQWDHDAENQWAVTSRDGRTGAQPGLVYVYHDDFAQTGAVSFRCDLINTDGSGKPNTLYVRIYGINGDFSWDHWNLGSNPSGDATLLHIAEITGSFDWTTFETPALPVGDGYEYYVLRFYPADVTTAEGDFMAIDNLYMSAAAPPPVFYDVTFSARANGTLEGNPSQTIVGGGSAEAVTAVPDSGYELAQWTWTGGGTSTDNPLVIANVSDDLAVTAHFQLFNNPPVSAITSPEDGASFPVNTAISFSGTGFDPEDGEITDAVWESSIDGVFAPVGGTYSGLSPGEHTIIRTVTDSGGKTGSDSITLILLEPLVRVAVADAMVRGDGSNADTNYGAATTIRTRSSESAEGLYRFDVDNVPGTLLSATLRLNLYANDTGTINVMEVADNSWGEMTVTYNTRPDYGEIIGQMSGEGVGQNNFMELDVTNYVLSRLPDGQASFATTGTGMLVRVNSREVAAAERHPQLVIVYTLEDINLEPLVEITSPANETVVFAGDEVIFEGTALDPEDGDLTAAAVWTSSLDGPLGSGGALSLDTLSVGEHLITLSVTDSGGLSDMEQISLTVEAAPPVPAVPPGYVSVLDFGADPSGQTDSTAALQDTINHGIAHQVAVWFPAGEYRISERLIADQPDDDPDYPAVLIGSTADPSQRAVIVLAANSPGFNNPDARRVMLHFFNRGTADNESGENTLYNQAVIGIDFRVESGNDGAVALRMQGAEGCTIQDVHIDLTQGGHTGIWGVPGSGGTTHQVSVTGGVIGVDTRKQNLSGGGSQPTVTITGSGFVGQSDVGVWASTRGAMVLVGAHFERDTPGPVLRLQRHHAEQPFDGTLQMVDCTVVHSVHHPDNTVIDMPAGEGRSFYLENVFVQNGERIWTEDAPANPFGWMRFARLAAEVRPDSQSWGQPMEVVWINGLTREGILLESEADAAPPADLQSRHQWASDFPTWETSGAVNALDHGAAGDGVTDDQAALQALIDAHDIVFLPKGHYRVSDTLHLRPESKLIGVHHNYSVIEALSTLDDRFADTTEEAGDRPIVSTADDANAETVLAFLHLKRHYPLAQHNPTPVGNYALEWRSGGDSVLRGVRLESRSTENIRPDFVASQFYGLGGGVNANYPQDDFPEGMWAWPGSEPTVQVRGNGGGHWFGFWVHGRQALRSHVPFLRVEGTRQPLHFYHLHLQQQDSVNHAEFLDVENVSVYGTKSELKGTLLYFEDSRHFRIFGSGGLASPDPNRPNPYLFRFVDCDDFQISGFAETVNPDASEWIGGPFDRWIHANVLGWNSVQDAHAGRLDVVVPSTYRPVLYLRTPEIEPPPGPTGAIFAQNFSGSSQVGDYVGSDDHLFDFIGVANSDNRATLSITGGRLRNTIAYTDDENESQFSAARATRRTDLPVEENFAVVQAVVRLAPDNWPGSDTTYFGLNVGQNFRAGIFNPAGGSGNGPAFGTLNLQARGSNPGAFRTTGSGGNSGNFTVSADDGVYVVDVVFAANGGAEPQTFLSPTGSHTLQPGRVSVWMNGALHIDNTGENVNAAEIVNVSFSTGSGTAQGYESGSVFNGYYEIGEVTVRTVSNYAGGAPDPYEIWALENDIGGSPTDLTDGVSNLLRYALGGDAETPASDFLLVPELSGDGMRLSFTRIDDDRLTYEVWAADQLPDWQRVWEGQGAGLGEVHVPASSNQLFLHLRVRRE
ncbi:MAG: DNRLRE domain-containing protein [Verrucomicrobia bacterium]|nr:DNRLRE domain-containing protein [Verrucomicrobiota bacterium]